VRMVMALTVGRHPVFRNQADTLVQPVKYLRAAGRTASAMRLGGGDGKGDGKRSAGARFNRQLAT
jgi:hypothetical protein